MGMWEKKNKKKKQEQTDILLPVKPAQNETGSAQKNGAALTPWNERRHRVRAPHALTPEELLGDKYQSPVKPTKEIPMEHTGAQPAESGQESLYIRMLRQKQAQVGAVPQTGAASPAGAQQLASQGAPSSRQATDAKSEQTENYSAPPKQTVLPRTQTVESEGGRTASAQPDAATRDAAFSYETPPQPAVPEVSAKATGPTSAELKIQPTAGEHPPLEQENANRSGTLRSAPAGKSASQEVAPAAQASFAAQKTPSLLERCANFVADENGNSVVKEVPTYQLESVDDIIMAAEQKARARAERLYGHLPTDPAVQAQPSADRPTTPEKAERAPVPVKVQIIDMEHSGSIMKTTPVEPPADEPPASEPQGKESENYQYSFAADPALLDQIRTRTTEFPLQATQEDLSAPSALDDAEAETEKWEDPEQHKTKSIQLFDGEEPENDPDDTPPTFDLPEALQLDDYTCLDDAPAIETDLKSRRARLIVRLCITALCGVLCALTLSPLFASLRADHAMAYAAIQFMLVAGVALANVNTMQGLVTLFCGRPDMDTPAALGVTAVLIHSVVSLFLTGMPALALLAPVTLLGSCICKLLIVSRIKTGFAHIANSNQKRAVQLIDNETVTGVMARGAIDSDALICVGRRTVNVKDYLKHAYSADPFEILVPRITLIVSVLAVLTGFVASLFTNLSTGITLAAVIFALASTPAAALLCHLPLKLAANRLHKRKAALTGYASVDAISQANVVTFDILDMFPAGSVKLYNMHMLSKNAIDQSLLEAASVAISARSPLSGIFEKMIEGDHTLLPAVDSINYENRMGLSGWIGERRILIGNRTLMEGHGIPLPAISVDRKILKSGYFPVYIVSDGRPCALLVVGYEPDESIVYEMRRLCNTGVTVLVNSCDPNVSEQMLLDYFGLPEGSVKLMSSDGVVAYKQATNYQESASGEAVCEPGDLCGFASVVTACNRLKGLISTNMILYILMTFGSIALACYAAFTGAFGLLGALSVAVYQVFSAAVVLLTSLMKRT